MESVIIFFHHFDPVNESVLNLLEHCSKELSIKKVILFHDFLDQKEKIFIQSEKVILLNACIEKRHKNIFVIDGDSFVQKSKYFLDKIIDFKKRNVENNIYWVLTSKQYLFFKDNPDFQVIFNLVNVAIYLFTNDHEAMCEYQISNSRITFIPTDPNINFIDDSIYLLEKTSFSPILIEYINKSPECAIKRIKTLQNKDRFSHSLRVAGTIKKICEFAGIDDHDLKYRCYMTALYHDICKNLPINEQIEIAQKELNVDKYPSTKVLHGPVGAWYMRTKYLFNDEEILNAIEEHTIPSENPSLLTKLIFLADKLELGKKEDFLHDEYQKYWELIAEKKVDEAFNLLKTNLHNKKPII